MTIKNVPWTPPVNYLWKVTGDGYFFHDFYVEGEDHSRAKAHAEDALAGSDGTQKVGRRFYGTVDKHIKSITKTGVVVERPSALSGNYHDTRLVMLGDTNREDEMT